MRKLLTFGHFLTCIRAAHLLMDQSKPHTLVKRLTLMLRYFDEDQYFKDVYPLYLRILEKSVSTGDDPITTEYLKLDESMQQVKQLMKKRGKAVKIEELVPKLSKKCSHLTKSSSIGIQVACQAIAHYNQEFVSKFVLGKERAPASPKELSILVSGDNLWVNSIEFNTISWTLQRDILKFYASAHTEDEEIYEKLVRLSKNFRLVMEKIPKATITNSVIAESQPPSPNMKPILSRTVVDRSECMDSICTFDTINNYSIDNSSSSNTPPKSIEDHIILIFIAVSLFFLCTASVVNRFVL